jgi:hypothetical protein
VGSVQEEESWKRRSTIKIEKAPVRCEVGSDRCDTPPVSFCKRHSLNFL